ncbi:MAG: FAD-dependent oxidoreductase, partial [Pseudomonadota bacterium]
YALHRAGHEVVLVERNATPGQETSWGNGGIIHTSEAGPWSEPGAWREVLRSIGREDAPLLLRSKALPSLWRWGPAFLRECAPARFRRNLHANLTLAVESVAALERIRAETGITHDEVTRGTLEVCHDQKTLDHLVHKLQPLAEHGLRFRVLDRAAATALEPALASASQDVVGAVHFHADQSGCCETFTRRVADWLVERGVELQGGTTVRRLLVEEGRIIGADTDRGALRADAVVVALGPWSRPLLRAVGVEVPIYPVKGVSLTLDRSPWPDGPTMTVLDHGWFFALTPLGDRLRVAGSAEFTGGFDATPAPGRIRAILDRAVHVFPALRACAEAPGRRDWAGFRPIVPSGVPLVGIEPRPGLWLNVGHGHLGWTLACGSAERLARAIGGHNAARAA